MMIGQQALIADTVLASVRIAHASGELAPDNFEALAATAARLVARASVRLARLSGVPVSGDFVSLVDAATRGAVLASVRMTHSSGHLTPDRFERIAGVVANNAASVLSLSEECDAEDTGGITDGGAA